MAPSKRKPLFALLALLAVAAVIVLGPARRPLCEAAAARSPEHRNLCTGEILNRVLLRIDAGADSLTGSALALEHRHVYPGKDPFYETVRAEFTPFRPGRYELGAAGAPVVRYTAGVLGQPKLRCVGVVKAGAIDVREAPEGGIEASFELKPSCVIAPGVGATEFHDRGRYVEIRELGHL